MEDRLDRIIELLEELIDTIDKPVESDSVREIMEKFVTKGDVSRKGKR